MPLPVVAALGTYASALGIYSFFDDALSGSAPADPQVLASLGRIEGELARLQGLSDAIINQSIAQSIGQSQTALDILERFAAEESENTRATLAESAIQSASQGLNAVVSQVLAVKDTASLDSLAYAFGAVHYAMLARQAVANSVQDGPLGAPGLHRQIKEAAALLYDETFRQSDLMWQIEGRMANSFDYNYVRTDEPINGGSFLNPALAVQGVYTITVTSEITDDSETFRLFERGTVSGSAGFRIFTPSETDDQFAERARQKAIDLAEEIFGRDMENAGVNTLIEIGLAANAHLALNADSVSGLYETIGSAEGEYLSGTARADFISGLQGDDELWGGRENLNGDPGGPDALSGGSGNDILRGGGANDFLKGGPGNDILIAGDVHTEMGTEDVARFEGLSSDYEIRGGSTYAIITGRDGERDKTFGVQYLRFDNEVIALAEGSALDGAGDPADFVTAERVALLYEAALNRDGNIDLPGLNFYISVTERDSLSDEFLAQDLMTSPEFTANFGNANTLSNSDFLEQIYLNVLDRASDAAGRQFYLDLLTAGTITKALALADIAISPENTAESVDVLMGLYENSAGEWSFL